MDLEMWDFSSFKAFFFYHFFYPLLPSPYPISSHPTFFPTFIQSKSSGVRVWTPVWFPVSLCEIHRAPCWKGKYDPVILFSLSFSLSLLLTVELLIKKRLLGGQWPLPVTWTLLAKTLFGAPHPPHLSHYGRWLRDSMPGKLWPNLTVMESA